MKDQYSINEILNAINDLQGLKRKKKLNTVAMNKPITKKNLEIPSNTLKLIEEAEKTIKSKLKSE
tara:strand:- start:223 stop:417 length:195 start_codon:yes stop_codon:yes gene_type:complete